MDLNHETHEKHEKKSELKISVNWCLFVVLNVSIEARALRIFTINQGEGGNGNRQATCWRRSQQRISGIDSINYFHSEAYMSHRGLLQHSSGRKKLKMAVELFPSSFRCDCGQELDFSENTIREMKKMSKKKKTSLGNGEHTIVFDKGKAIEIRCPKLGKCPITGIDYE